MSHFTVLVIGDDVDGQLAPYSENLHVEPYIDADEPADHWLANSTRKSLDLADDAVVTAEQIVSYHNGEYAKGAPLLPTAEEAQKLEATEDHDEVYFVHEGKVATWSTRNPSGFWDWYELGGRWTGFWKLNAFGVRALAITSGAVEPTSALDGALAEHATAAPRVGRPGVGTSRAKPGYADSALKRHIDFDGMRVEARAQASAEWERYVGAVADVVAEHGFGRTWTEAREAFDDINDARAMYGAQPYVVTLRASGVGPFLDEPREYYGPDLGDETRTAFLDRAADRAFSTYAVVMHGQWHGKGRMGWWATSHDEKYTQEEWNQRLRRLIDSLEPNDRLSIVDAHV